MEKLGNNGKNLKLLNTKDLGRNIGKSCDYAVYTCF